ncbi:hypothetical protein F4677DRAFT_435111 [Hypoxylon crocopeplum]|nr:hypothetical protein F4677DRAFT_435111 [Hypoxylon crocopeplum]
MRSLTFLAVLLAPLGAITTPAPARTNPWYDPSTNLYGTKSNDGTPPPCVFMAPEPNEEETHARFDKFADAFMVKRNLTEVFEYISSIYINHNPLAKDGPDSALEVLGPIWNQLQITPIRRKFKRNMGWLDYKTNSSGEVVDRFRWKAGCIVEHWDQGEKFPEM